MFKQIFRITFVTLVWKQYKNVIVSTLLLFGYLWLVGSIHDDYLIYAEDQNDEGLVGRSFLYKWAALVSGVSLYLVYHWFRNSRPTKNVEDGATNKSLFRKSNSDNRAMNSPLQEAQDQDDPFATLRDKEKLRSRAEILVDQEKHR